MQYNTVRVEIKLVHNWIRTNKIPLNSNRIFFLKIKHKNSVPSWFYSKRSFDFHRLHIKWEISNLIYSSLILTWPWTPNLPGHRLRLGLAYSSLNRLWTHYAMLLKFHITSIFLIVVLVLRHGEWLPRENSSSQKIKR